MTCVLCGQPIDGAAPTVPTTDGQRVHIACADRASRVGDQRRVIRAGITAFGLVGLLLMAAFLWPRVFIIPLIPFGVLIHVTLNRRWWRLRAQSARLWAWRTRHARWRPWRRPRR